MAQDKFACSKMVMDAIKVAATPTSVFYPYGIEVKESSVFPFEIYYDACDIETKEEYKIASGVWVHGVMVPPLPELPLIEFDFKLSSSEMYWRSSALFNSFNRIL